MLAAKIVNTVERAVRFILKIYKEKPVFLVRFLAILKRHPKNTI
ncbi:hypothetical protein CJ739_894 [Mariniflexile rhizosphaerae]|nr:hypothetical protein CJ739_894 [Mariniflexile sp. TRM1-10]PLB21007.1 MAG: hypothetical protein TRG1_100 [Flavobacteriaceae bacterium FS1-H7996/R]